jgi:hypothetical protein
VSYGALRRGACLALLGALAAAPTGAQTTVESVDASKTLTIVRLAGAPRVDGMLDEPTWANATLVTDLHQLDPVEYAAPSQRSEIRLYFDDDALYVAARMWDTEADRITAQVLRQGEGMGSEDRFSVILDPYLDRRNGYRFQVNPNGVRWEALYQDTSNLESNWDGIWFAAATRDEQGWTAEMAIPFKTLSFNPNSGQWGINFERTIQRNGETLGWVSRNRQMNPGVAGTATGLEGLRQGAGLDVVPSMSVRQSKVYATGETATEAEPSLDIFYKVTPSLNAALTINTDFSATEIDDRQVNLTRFSLFFPEKRDFFLQDADIFEFGRIGSGGFQGGRPGGGGAGGGGGGGGGGGNPAIPGAAVQNARPFFSRKLGLSSTGQLIDIEHGAKLSGRVGRFSLGALAIRQDDLQAIEGDDTLVARVAANVLGESALGVIVTDGDPQSNNDSSLAGADFRYRNSRLPGGRLLESQAWYQESDNVGPNLRTGTPFTDDDNRAFGVGVNMPNSVGWRGGFSSRQVENNFYPAVGFIDRIGIRDQALDFGRTWRFVGKPLRSFYTGLDNYRVTKLDTGNEESKIISLRVTAQNNTQDNLFSRAVVNREVLLAPFTIYVAPEDPSFRVVIPAGDYTFTDYRIGIDSGDQRKIALRVALTAGEYFAGRHENSSGEVTWRPSPKLRFGLSYDAHEIDLPAGEFTVRQSTLRAELIFSSTLSWVNLIQYDNVSENLGLNSRLHWIPQAGREGFIVLNRNMTDLDRDDSFTPVAADLAMRFSYTWRF